MAFTPWLQHLVQAGRCLDCGIVIPKEAVVDGVAFSHGGSFHTNPVGAVVPCTAKPI